tara:strand:+ start:2574 stop:3299 length:726 start_codon:yes stop_codon:yes gene_type:complete
MKNIVYIVAINWKLQETSIKGWEYWCNKNDCDFYVIDEPVVDVKDMAPHWQRYYIYDILDNQNIEYDNILYVDADAMVKWDAPNFFEMSNGNLGVVKDFASYEWVWNGIKGYKQLFPTIDYDWNDYFCTSFLMSNKKHKQFYQDIISFYFKNQDKIQDLQYNTLKKGFDQTPVNYLTKLHNIELQYLPKQCHMGNLPQKYILQNGIFIEMGYTWGFNGMSDEEKDRIMKLVWEDVKGNYEL